MLFKILKIYFVCFVKFVSVDRSFHSFKCFWAVFFLLIGSVFNGELAGFCG